MESLDTLFFRDGKPFTMGDDNWANGMLLPQPSVIYGALRSAYFSNHIADLKKAANTDDDPTKNLRIRGIYLFDKTENIFYLPLPNDCVQKKIDSKENKTHVLSIVELDKIKSSCPSEYAPKGKEEVENVNSAMIDLELLQKYLESSEKTFSFLNMSDKILIESKLGIGINKKIGTSEDGKLYRIGMSRMNDMNLIIEFDGMNLPESGFMKLGGEGKAIHYEKFPYQKPDVSISIDEQSDKRFKLYLSTPAIFKNGWIPEWLNNKDMIYETNKLNIIKLLTVAIGKSISIGGFDIKSNKPKPMLKAVPAGSIYYFEILNGEFKKVYEEFNNKAISEYYPEQGYGVVFVGRIHENI